MPPQLVQGMREIRFPRNMTNLEESGGGRLRTMLASRTLHEAWAEYDRIAASDDAILRARCEHFWHRPRYERGSITRGLRREFIHHPGCGYIPLALNPPSTSMRRKLGGTNSDERHARATAVLLRRATTWDSVALETLLASFLAFSRVRTRSLRLFFRFCALFQCVVHDGIV